jgi:hypothetical protein
MLDLILFFWNVLRAFFGRPFVADPNSWMTRSNRAFSERWEQPMAQSVCPYFWRAVYIEPLTRGPRFMPGQVSNYSLMLLLTLGIGLGAAYLQWMPMYPQLGFGGATIGGLAIGFFTFFLMSLLLRLRMMLILIPFVLVAAVILFINDWRSLVTSYAIIFGIVIVGATIFFVGTRYFCPRISYNTQEIES